MNDPRSTPPPDEHRDRSLGLILFGAVEILLGLACAALVPLTLIAVSLSPTFDASVVLPSLLLYAAIGVVFISLGVGSIRARRWAQALSLSLSWVWLITGVATILLTWIVLPTLWFDLAVSTGLDDGAARLTALAINIILSVIYVILPGAFVLFYRSPNVIATCRIRDPKPGWTGRCPQPLLALAVAYVLGGVSIISVPTYGYVFPFFGILLSGVAGAACWAVVLILSLVLARGTCRREPWAWWTAMAASIAAAISSSVTFARVEAAEVVETMGLLPEQRLMFEQLWPQEPWVHMVIWVTVWGSLAAYLWYVRTLFNPPLGHRRSQE